jgi:hypothetical protein
MMKPSTRACFAVAFACFAALAVIGACGREPLEGVPVMALDAGAPDATLPVVEARTEEGHKLGANYSSAPYGSGFLRSSDGSISPVASPVNLADANDIGSSVLQPANGGTGLSAVGAAGTVLTSDGSAASWAAGATSLPPCDAGSFLQSDGGGVYSCVPAPQTDAGFAAPPPYGNGTGNAVFSTTLANDAGVTTCAGSAAPDQNTCSAIATMTASTWTVFDTVSLAPVSQHLRIREDFLAADFGSAGATGNFQGGVLVVDVTSLVDGGASIALSGQTSTTSTFGPIVPNDPLSATGCDGGQGCTLGGWNTQWSFEAAIDAGSVVVLAAVDAGAYRANVEHSVKSTR